IGLMALLMIFFWPKRVGKFLPGPLAALIAGTLLCLFIPNVPLLEFETGWPHFVMPSINSATFLIVFVAAVQLSLLGAVDSLLTSLIADNATRTRHNSNQELIGQGIGNSIAGLFGAIPGAGATMRTMVNIKSGGTTKISGMVHALLLLAVVVALAPLAKNIPNTVLAGILIKVGWDIIDWAYIRSLMKGPRFDYFLMVVVLVLTVFTDLITAVGSGVFLACAAYVWNMAEDQLEDIERTGNSTTTDEEMQLIDQTGGSVSLFDFGGPLSFAAAADLGHHVRRRSAKDTEAIVLDFSRITFVDVSSAQAVDTIASDAKDAGKLVFTSGMNDQVREKLVGLGSDVHLEPANDFSRRIDALKAAAKAVLTGSKDSDTQSDTGMNSAVPAE
ncbi:MAG: SulP family inorganic anion transporter, partial [Pseudomonadota bacterium]